MRKRTVFKTAVSIFLSATMGMTSISVSAQDIFSDSESVQENTAPEGENLFSDGEDALSKGTEENTVVQDGVIYECGKYFASVKGYTEELKNISKIVIAAYIGDLPVSTMAEGCLKGLENVTIIEIPGTMEVISLNILDSWEGVTISCSEHSWVQSFAERNGIAYDTSNMPATYVADSDGNGLAYVFDWKNQTYTAAGLERMSKLTDVVYKDEIMGYPVTEIDTEKFSMIYFDEHQLDYRNVRSLYIPDGIQRIDGYEYSMYDEILYVDDFGPTNYRNLVSVVFEEGDTPIKLEGGLFKDCISLSDIQFSSRVRELPAYMFTNCPALTRLELPEGMVKINEAALQGAQNLEYLYIPSSVTEIADDAMDGLTKVTVHGKENSYGEYYCRAHGIPFVADGSIEPEQPYIIHAGSQIIDHSLYFSIRFLRDGEGAEGYEFQSLASDGKTILRTKKSASSKTVLRKAPNNIYVRARYWKTENGQKVYSAWSNMEHLYLDLKGGNMILKNASVKGNKVTVTFADNADFFKESDGYDCKLSNFDGTGKNYVLRNRKYRTINFTNVNKGIYFVSARAYKLVNGKKYYGEESNNKKIVVK